MNQTNEHSDEALKSYYYHLGAADVFCEMVRAGVKKIALSHPCGSKEERDRFLPDFTDLCEKYGVSYYVEDDPIITDLFPKAMNLGKFQVIFYQDDECLRQYLDLKKEKADAVENGTYAMIRADLAYRYGKLLSYTDEGIRRLLLETGKTALVSVEEMRSRDLQTIESGTSGTALMGRAARGIYKAYDGFRDGTVILCGSGNNGGDGYALSAVLSEEGISSRVLVMSEKTTPESAYYKEKALACGVSMEEYRPGTHQLDHAPVVVDCLLGTGFQGEVREPYRSAIQEMNDARKSGAFVISADINSGMNGDRGTGSLITDSDLTVTIGLMKTGLLTEAARAHIGRLVLADIGIL